MKTQPIVTFRVALTAVGLFLLASPGTSDAVFIVQGCAPTQATCTSDCELDRDIVCQASEGVCSTTALTST